MDLGEVEELLREGWRPYVQRKGKYVYIVLRRGKRTRSLGAFSEELWREVLRLAGRVSEKEVPRGAEGGNLFPRAAPRWEGGLEETEAGPSPIAEGVPPEVPEPIAELQVWGSSLAPAVRSLGNLLEERRRRMLEEAKLELERLHLERLKRLLGAGERGEEPPQLDLQLLTLCALAARNPWEALALYLLCLSLRQLLGHPA
jgi:hypothetical protein